MVCDKNDTHKAQSHSLRCSDLSYPSLTLKAASILASELVWHWCIHSRVWGAFKRMLPPFCSPVISPRSGSDKLEYATNERLRWTDRQRERRHASRSSCSASRSAWVMHIVISEQQTFSQAAYHTLLSLTCLKLRRRRVNAWKIKSQHSDQARDTHSNVQI